MKRLVLFLFLAGTNTFASVYCPQTITCNNGNCPFDNKYFYQFRYYKFHGTYHFFTANYLGTSICSYVNEQQMPGPSLQSKLVVPDQGGGWYLRDSGAWCGVANYTGDGSDANFCPFKLSKV